MTDEYPQTLQLVFKHRPWDFHPRSALAHLAAEEAHAQGRFWSYALAILEGVEEELDPPRLEALGAQQGMDGPKLKAALGSGAAQPHVDLDRAQAEALEINSTPTLFVNGRRIVGDEPLEFWRKEIDAELVRLAPAPAAAPPPVTEQP